MISFLAFMAPGCLLLLADCDDNIFTNPFRLCALLALGVSAGVIDNPSPLVRRLCSPILVGALFGLALLVHLQSIILLIYIPLVYLWMTQTRSFSDRCRSAIAALSVAIGFYAVCVGVVLCAQPSPLPGEQVRMAFEEITASRSWAFEMFTHPLKHANNVGVGLLASFVMLPALLPSLKVWLVSAWVSLILILIGYVILAFKAGFNRVGRFFLYALGIQAAHALIFESINPERWDFSIILLSLLAVCALAKGAVNTKMRAVVSALFCVQLLWSGILVYRLAVVAPQLLADSTKQAHVDASSMGMAWHCYGAHRTLRLAVDRFKGLLVTPKTIGLAKVGFADQYFQYNFEQWLLTYLALYCPSAREVLLDGAQSNGGYAYFLGYGFPLQPLKAPCFAVEHEGFVTLYRCSE